MNQNGTIQEKELDSLSDDVPKENLPDMFDFIAEQGDRVATTCIIIGESSTEIMVTVCSFIVSIYPIDSWRKKGTIFFIRLVFKRFFFSISFYKMLLMHFQS